MVKRLNRREFISKTGMAVAGVTGAALAGKGWGTVHIRNPKIKDKIFVLGIDGMDPGLDKTNAFTILCKSLFAAER